MTGQDYRDVWLKLSGEADSNIGRMVSRTITNRLMPADANMRICGIYRLQLNNYCREAP